MQLNKYELDILEAIKKRLVDEGIYMPNMDHEILSSALFAFDIFIRDSFSHPHRGEKKNDA